MSKRVCVIGAGLAGGILSSKLAEAGCDVILVEQGRDAEPLIPRDETWHGTDHRAVFTRGQGVGGSSNFWHGGLITFDQSDIEWPGPARDGPKYPISYEHLSVYYRHALELMSGGQISQRDLYRTDGHESQWRLRSEAFQYKPLIFPSNPFSTASLIRTAEKRRRLRVVTGAQVERLVFADAAHVRSVEASPPQGGDPIRIEADIFVLCAGGIGSPKILLKSVDKNAQLARLPIGRFLTDHPTGFAFKARLRRRLALKDLFGTPVPPSRTMKRRLGFVLRDTRLETVDYRNHILYLRPAFSLGDPDNYARLKARLVAHRGKHLTISDIVGIARHADLFAEAVNFRLGALTSVRHVAGFVFAEQLPLAHNAITLTDRGTFNIDWEVSKEDAASLDAFLKAFVADHDDAFEEVVFFPGQLGSGAHHSGGCRMAAEESMGVVGGNLRVFGTDNLYVADASVLGFTGHANTGLSIGAIALMCANEILAGTSPRT